MSAYTILLILTLLVGTASGVWGILVGKKWVQTTTCVLLVLCLIAVLISAAACFGTLMNEDIVVERRAWREMVERGEIEVYDDCGHLTLEAARYNVEIAKIHNSIRRYGRWSTWYGTGAELLMPITKED
jgi:hypothetical protein